MGERFWVQKLQIFEPFIIVKKPGCPEKLLRFSGHDMDRMLVSYEMSLPKITISNRKD